MKTERRHELQENELANWLGDHIARVAPYGKTFLALLVLGLVGLLIMNYAKGRRALSQTAGWTAYFDAESPRDAGGADPERFEQVADTFPDTVAGHWALLTAADLRLDESLRAMFQDRKLAQEELTAARQLYERLAATQADAMVQQRAAYGLAKCLEAQGDFEQATRQYEQVVSNWSGSQLAALATERLEALKRPETKQWYNWFAQQQPVTSPLNDPGLFQDLPNLPDTPDLNMPRPGGLLGPSGSSSVPSDATGSDPVLPPLPGEIPAADGPADQIELPLLPELGGDAPATSDAAPGTADEPVKLELDLPLTEESPTP